MPDSKLCIYTQKAHFVSTLLPFNQSTSVQITFWCRVEGFCLFCLAKMALLWNISCTDGNIDGHTFFSLGK